MFNAKIILCLIQLIKKVEATLPTRSGSTTSCSTRLCLPKFATGTKHQSFDNVKFSKIPSLSLSLCVTENKDVLSVHLLVYFTGSIFL